MASTSGWAIDGPVKTPVEDARRLTYGLSGDAHGVASLSDLITRPTNPTGGAVQVSPGSCLIKSRYSDGQTYLASLNEATTLAVTPTPSGSGRTDLVVFEVLDPWAQNSPVPEPLDPETFEFFKLHVIEGVPAGINVKHLHQVPGYANRTGLVLSRLTIPANRGDVQSSMISRIAGPHTPKELTRVLYYSLSGSEVELITSTSEGGQTWPTQAEDAGELGLDIPEWATHAETQAAFYGVIYPGGNARGMLWLQLAQTVNPNNVKSQTTSWDSDGESNAHRVTLGLADTIAIPQELRGTRQKIFPRARRTAGTNTTTARLNATSSIAITVTFQERG
ncbi:hypothetical protein [Leucobacter sp. NPDC077196]|uniref:hypothetical protein n=1 Tax=Leucobacter sp. NPDC077196 TaxID=3154959 RepID=UPI00341A6342